MGGERAASLRQRVRHVPHVPLARHDPLEGDAPLLLAVRNLRLSMLRRLHQIGFPGCHRQTCCHTRENGVETSAPSLPFLFVFFFFCFGGVEKKNFAKKKKKKKKKK